jgi:predicted RNase H-like HicB family nuclease
MQAIALHVEALRQDGEPVPAPSAHVEYVDIAAAA